MLPGVCGRTELGLELRRKTEGVAAPKTGSRLFAERITLSYNAADSKDVSVGHEMPAAAAEPGRKQGKSL